VHRKLASCFAAALIAGAAIAQQPAAIKPDRAAQPSPQALVAALKSGGYIVYFRHAATDFSANDEKMRDFDDCANQRNLTDAGREQARKIGAAWRALALPVGRVHASPFCRTRETAQLAFGRYERASEARGGPGTASDAARYRPLSELLSTPPPAGTNDIVVSHGNPFRALHPDMPYLQEGEGAVIRPKGAGGHEVVGRITSESWTN
jgi:phosphohistidine phosphatase SixA